MPKEDSRRDNWITSSFGSDQGVCQPVSVEAIGRGRTVLICVFASVGLLAPVVQASAQSDVGAESTHTTTDIIVTARKRMESTLDVPVAITAIGKADLERYGTRDLISLSAQVPGLSMQQMAAGSGGVVAMRGVSSSPTNPSIDQAISFNIDGVQVGSANMLRLGMIDVQQIEILKGPQALFFGKNSPGGVISLRSADPGDRFEASAVAGYEFNAKERTAQLVVGGPITDTIGIRAVAYIAHMDGYRFNRAEGVVDPLNNLVVAPPARIRAPKREEEFYRGTLVFEPSDSLSVRLKYSYSRVSGSDPWTTAERLFCPNGAPQVGIAGPLAAVDDCRANGVFYQGDLNPVGVAKFSRLIPFIGLRSRQHLASAEVNYDLGSDIKLTSVSGYYNVKDGFFGSASYQPVSLINSGSGVDRREISQELRLATDRAEWPVNFTVGAYYQNVKFQNFVGPVVLIDPRGAGTATLAQYSQFYSDTNAYSVFGQAIWAISPTLELAGGLRWSREEKDLNFFLTSGTSNETLLRREITTSRPKVAFVDKSPEVTLTWRPSPSTSVFAAFRNGFKSGGFNTGTALALGTDLSYKPEDVRGGEVGFKYASSRLRINAAAYRYIYKNLQVSTFDPITFAQKVINAASSKIYGIEADVAYSPAAVEGLSLRASANYNHARYSSFIAGCYTGQTISEGCNLNPTTAGVFRQQDLSGRPLILAPEFTGSVGASYTASVGSNLRLSMSGDANYSSSFWAQLEEIPGGKQNDYWMFNMSARVGADDDRWELALIGQNLTEVYRSRFVSQAPGSGISSRTGTSIIGGRSDLTGQINRGREIRLQVTVKLM